MMADVAGRYASALFDLAQEKGQLNEVDNDLNQIETMLAESEELRYVVNSPVFSADDQNAALEGVLKSSRATDLTINLIKLLVKNRRLPVIGDIIIAYRTLVAQARGEVTAQVTTASELSDEHMTMLTESLKASLGKDVQIDAKVDPSLLGGLIVKVGSRMVDSSLRTKLGTLKLRMKEVG